MTERTCNIIRACKGTLCWGIEDRLERIKTYLSAECDCDKEDYTDADIESIMINAAYDYIDTCDKPSSFLRLMYECIAKPVNLADRIAIAFTLVQVKRDDEYINGFKKEFFE
jgi:hypothetical protein